MDELPLIGVRWIVTSEANWGGGLMHRDLEVELDIFALSLRREFLGLLGAALRGGLNSPTV